MLWTFSELICKALYAILNEMQEMDSEIIWDILKFPNFEYHPASLSMGHSQKGCIIIGEAGFYSERLSLTLTGWARLKRLDNTQNLGISECPKSFQNPLRVLIPKGQNLSGFWNKNQVGAQGDLSS